MTAASLVTLLEEFHIGAFVRPYSDKSAARLAARHGGRQTLGVIGMRIDAAGRLLLQVTDNWPHGNVSELPATELSVIGSALSSHEKGAGCAAEIELERRRALLADIKAALAEKQITEAHLALDRLGAPRARYGSPPLSVAERIGAIRRSGLLADKRILLAIGLILGLIALQAWVSQ